MFEERESVFVLSVSLNVSCVIRSPARHIVMRGWEGITANPTLRCKRAGTCGDWINLIRQPAIYPSKCYATSNHKIRNITDHRKQRMHKKLLLTLTTPATRLEHCEETPCWALDVHLMPHSTNNFSVQIMYWKRAIFYTFGDMFYPEVHLHIRMMYISIETIFVKNFVFCDSCWSKLCCIKKSIFWGILVCWSDAKVTLNVSKVM